MRYGIGTLRDNQRTRLCLIWINCMWKKSVDNKALVVWLSRDFRRDMTWHDVTLRDMTWHNVAWHDVTWRYITWHDVTWRDMRWHDMTWHDVTWRDMTWHDVTWRDMTWYDVTLHDMTIKLTIKRWSCDSPTTFARLLINLELFCQGTNVWVTSKTSWTGRWSEFLRSPKHGSSVGMSSKDSLTSKT